MVEICERVISVKKKMQNLEILELGPRKFMSTKEFTLGGVCFNISNKIIAKVNLRILCSQFLYEF